jgi:hypothetical protein
MRPEVAITRHCTHHARFPRPWTFMRPGASTSAPREHPAPEATCGPWDGTSFVTPKVVLQIGVTGTDMQYGPERVPPLAQRLLATLPTEGSCLRRREERGDPAGGFGPFVFDRKNSEGTAPHS